MTTDWKALCVELAKVLAEEYGVQREFANGDPLLGSGAIELLSRVRTHLFQPEPEEPTDEELEAIARAAEIQYMKEHGGLTASTPDGIHAQLRVQRIAGLRAVAARWGRPAIKPVPVSERPIFKGNNFNDANGHCWCGMCASIDITEDLPMETPSSWKLREPRAQDDCVLPHYALPVPTFTETP